MTRQDPGIWPSGASPCLSLGSLSGKWH